MAARRSVFTGFAAAVLTLAVLSPALLAGLLSGCAPDHAETGGENDREMRAAEALGGELSAVDRDNFTLNGARFELADEQADDQAREWRRLVLRLGRESIPNLLPGVSAEAE